jgi:hypothetical protein
MVLRTRLFVALVFNLLCGVAAAHAQEMRLTAGSNVRLRAEPSPSSAVLEQLPLGSDLVRLPADVDNPSWLRVRTSAGREGWVSAPLTVPFTAAARFAVLDDLISRQLGPWPPPEWEERPLGIARFDSGTQAAALVDRIWPELPDREARGRFTLLKLLALRKAAAAVPFDVARKAREPYGSWLAAHEALVHYNEIGANWTLGYQALLRLHDEYRDTPSADDIAWLVVRNGLGGECEGDVPCYVNWQNMLMGEYLRRHPAGRYVSQAVAGLAERLDSIMDSLEQAPKVLAEFTPSRCGELHEGIEALRVAVWKSSAAEQGPALRALDRYARLCAPR